MKAKLRLGSLPAIHLSKFYFLFTGLLCCFFCANAQTPKKPAPTPAKVATPAAMPAKPAVAATPVKTVALVDKPPIAYSLDDYTKTPQYAKRKAKLDKSTPAPQVKTFKFNDGTTLKVSLDKKKPSDIMSGPVQKKVGETKKESSGAYDCTTTTVNLTSTSSSFLNNDYSGSTANIYPGACYTYANLTNGSWKQQSGARNAVQITTDNPNIKGKSYVTVKDPNAGTLESAVAELFSRMSRSSGTESLSYQVSDAANSATYNLQIGAAASGYGADLSNVYSTANQSNHVHLTIDATKTLFTISTTPPDSGFFKDPNVEGTPYLSYIGEVSYGVRVLANADLTFNSEQEADQFKGSYSGFGVSVSLSVGYGSGSKSTSETINGYMIGGPGNQVVAYSLDDLKKQIEKAFANATYQNARPIKYKACSMAGDVLNTYSATDNFNVRNCIPADGGSPEIQSIAITLQQGNDGKEAPTNFMVAVFPGTGGAGTGPDPESAMFLYTSGGLPPKQFNNNGTVTIMLTRTQNYKGKRDLATLQKEGGRVHIYPIGYVPNSVGGIGYDNWDIDGVSMVINLKPSSVNPNPQPLGGQKGNLAWTLTGANEVVMSSRNLNNADFFFDRNLAASGNQ